MKKMAGYVRVSTQEQKMHGYSVDNQISALTEFAHKNGYDIEIYNDAGISAHISYKKRPEMLRMISDCQKGLIQLICVTKLDRFFRSVPDYYAVMEQINGVPWRAIWEDYETETSSGQFKVNIMLSIAQAESERTSERIKAIVQYRKESGKYIGNIPWGYKRDENKRIVKDKEAESGVNAIIEAYDRCYSLSDCAIAVHASGHTDVTKYKIKNVLSNPFYTGKANLEEFEPYISAEQQTKYKIALSRRSRKRPEQKYTYLFSGLLKCCDCGGNMLSHIHYCKRANGTVNKYKTYRCGRSQQYQCRTSFTVYEATMERRITAEIDRLVAQKAISATLEADAVKDYTKQIKSLKMRIKRLADMYEMGDIKRDEYISKRDNLQLDILRMESAKPKETIPDIPSDWKEIYSQLDESHKKAFWNKILKSVVVFKDHIDIVFM